MTYYAEYEQWLNDLPEPDRKEDGRGKSSSAAVKPAAPKKGQGRLSYMDQREYDQIEETIATEEVRVEELQKKMEEPEIVSDPTELARCWQELEAAQVEVERLYNRWDELEEKKSG